MVASDTAFTGSIPQLVRPIHGPHAVRALCARSRAAHQKPRTARCAGDGSGHRRPEPLRFAQALPEAASLTVTDLNEQMLVLAQAKPRLAGKSRVKWQQADALALPFGDASFDIVAVPGSA